MKATDVRLDQVAACSDSSWNGHDRATARRSASWAGTSISRLYAVANLILRSGDRAQDAVQEALVSAWPDVRALRDPDAWDAWLNRLTVRACYRWARKERRRNLVELYLEPDEDVAGTLAYSRALVDRDDLKREFGRLTIDQRAVLVLHFYLGLQLAEVAGILDSHRHRQVPAPPRSCRASWSDGCHAQCARWTGRGAPGMNTDPRLEQRVIAALNRAASTREPDGLVDSVLSTVGHTRTRPRWLALIKEPPMRIHSRVAVARRPSVSSPY